MRMRAFMMLGAAFVLASASVYLARAWIIEQAASRPAIPLAAQVAVTQIVVAAEPLPYGSKVLRAKLRLADWPAGSVPQGAFATIDDVVGTPGAAIEERLVLRSLTRDEPVLKSKISGFGARASLSTLIAPGLRAAAIRVNDINGVAGFVLPGDRVDVLLTRELGNGPGQRDLVTDILLQSMRVLGIDQDANAEREKPAVVRAVTLEVTQEEAQKLTLAQKLGTLSLALRNGSAADTLAPRSITARDLPLTAAAKTNVEADPPVPTLPAPTVNTRRDPSAALAGATARRPLSPVRIVRGLDVSTYEVAVEGPLARPDSASVAGLTSPSGVSASMSVPPVPRRRSQPPAPDARVAATSRGRSVPGSGSTVSTGHAQRQENADDGIVPRDPGEDG